MNALLTAAVLLNSVALVVVVAFFAVVLGPAAASVGFVMSFATVLITFLFFVPHGMGITPRTSD